MVPCPGDNGCCRQGISSRLCNIADHNGLAVCSTPFLLEKCAGRRIARCLQVRNAVRSLRKRGCACIVVYVWDFKLDVSTRVTQWNLKCYHIDDEYTWSETETPIPERERCLLSSVDQVFVHSERMFEKKGRLNPNTLLVPNGVDYAAYTATCQEPPDLASIPHPRIGCVGWVKRQLDLRLLLELSRRHSQWSFVFVGPSKPARHFGDQLATLEQLRKVPNVYFLGNKPVEELPSYTQYFDVGILCYCVNDYTKYINPLKLHEYLAAGIPAVGSDIPALRPFRDVVKIATTFDEWSDSLRAAIAPTAKSVEQRSARRAVANRYDWNQIVVTIVHAICARLGRRDIEPLLARHESKNVAHSGKCQ